MRRILLFLLISFAGQSFAAIKYNKIEMEKILYKTEICKEWQKAGSCRYGDRCKFAHGSKELKYKKVHKKYRTKICKHFFNFGACRYGERCGFIHIEIDDAYKNATEEKLDVNIEKMILWQKKSNRFLKAVELKKN